MWRAWSLVSRPYKIVRVLGRPSHNPGAWFVASGMSTPAQLGATHTTSLSRGSGPSRRLNAGFEPRMMIWMSLRRWPSQRGSWRNMDGNRRFPERTVSVLVPECDDFSLPNETPVRERGLGNLWTHCVQCHDTTRLRAERACRVRRDLAGCETSAPSAHRSRCRSSGGLVTRGKLLSGGAGWGSPRSCSLVALCLGGIALCRRSPGSLMSDPLMPRSEEQG